MEKEIFRTRRRFLGQVGQISCSALTVSATGIQAFGQDEDSGPVDCGPPPQAAPQSQTGGESFAPLPLPVTPLRRSEKKRPPSPPTLIGKAALGNPKWRTVDGKRTMYRDWMTDPADVKTLLDWTNEKLGINYKASEADLGNFSFDPRELPALLLAGHNSFSFTDIQRAQLQRFVMDGGTLIADACCGWKDFTDSFRNEMEIIFPGRVLRKMLPDNPIFSTYYRLDQAFTYKKADGEIYTDEPSLESIEFGCRDGVIFSSADMTCGWDGHEHPRGTRMTIDLARQVGANIVTYMLGTFQLGRFLSTSKIYFDEKAPARDEFVFAQIVHEGDWDPDPSAVYNLLKFAKDSSTLEVKFKRENIKISDPSALTYPIWYMTGHREFVFSNDDAARLRQFVEAGGIFLADACCGRTTFDTAFRSEIRKVFQDNPLVPIPKDHPIYHCHFELDKAEYTPRVAEDYGNIDEPELEAVMIDDKPVVIYSRFDLGNGWERFAHPYAYGYADQTALEIGTNLLIYAVTH